MSGVRSWWEALALKWRSCSIAAVSPLTIALWVPATRRISGMLLSSARAVRSPSATRWDAADNASSGSVISRAWRRATRIATSRQKPARAAMMSQASTTRRQITPAATDARTTPITFSPEATGTATMTSFPICPSAAPPWAARRVIASAAAGPRPARSRSVVS